MNQFFSDCKFIFLLIRDACIYKINNMKIIKNIKLLNDNIKLTRIDKFFIKRPNLLYYLIKLENILPINITRVETYIGNYYCHYKNKHGELKKIFNNFKLKDVILLGKEINITNKTDGTYGNYVILDIRLYNTTTMYNLDINNYITNIDIDTQINLKDMLNYEKIEYDKYNMIHIKVLSILTFEEKSIDYDIKDFLTKNITELI